MSARMSWILFLMVGGVWAAGQPSRDGKEPINLLIVTFDTTRYDFLSCYGSTKARTPNIDRLAQEGIRFERAYAQAPQTLPSHVSLFTGLYPITSNVVSNGQRLADEATTLAEILKLAGYRTGAVIGASPLHGEYNLKQGFETYHDDFGDPLLARAFKSFWRVFSAGKINIPSSRSADRVAKLGLQWLSHHARGRRPFFLWLHFFDPHHPYVRRPHFDKPEVVQEEGPLNQYGVGEFNYAREIEFADHYLGKILDYLDRKGLTDNTLVVFTADHGESLGEHGYRGHREEVYENIIRIPLLMRLPGKLPSGRTIRTPAMSIDVMPTVLSAMQIPYLASAYPGSDLLELDSQSPRKIYSMAVKLFTKAPIRRAVISGDLKFIEFDGDRPAALFNVAMDPAEERNLLENPSEADILEWRAELDSWFAQYEDLRPSDFSLTPDQIQSLQSLGYIQ